MPTEDDFSDYGYIDMHCHPAIKPYGKSFNKSPKGINATRRNSKSSIWHFNPPSLVDKLLNFIMGLTKFSQSDFTSLAQGGVQLVCVSLYPLEKPFVVNKIKNEFISDVAANFATGIGKKRIDAVQAFTNYFKDLEAEYEFYKQLDGKIIKLKTGNYRYKIVTSFTDIKKYKKPDKNGVQTIAIVISIEGLHVLNDSINAVFNEQSMLANFAEDKKLGTSAIFCVFSTSFLERTLWTCREF